MLGFGPISGLPLSSVEDGAEAEEDAGEVILSEPLTGRQVTATARPSRTISTTALQSRLRTASPRASRTVTTTPLSGRTIN